MGFAPCLPGPATFVLLICLLMGCGGGGGKQEHSAAPTPPSVAIPSSVATPRPSPPGLKALPAELLVKYGRDPVRLGLVHAFNQQVEQLSADPFVFGTSFLEVPAEAPGYSEGYFSILSSQDYPFIDGLQRPLVGALHPLADPMVKTYRSLLRSEGEHFVWRPHDVRRATGYLFTGSKAMRMEYLL